MHLVYYGHNLLDLKALSPALSWGVVLGGLYGMGRFVRDLVGVFAKAARHEPSESPYKRP